MTHIPDLLKAIRALRLNRFYPPHQRISGHLQAMLLLGEELSFHQGWPLTKYWQQVRVDKKIAPRLREQFSQLAYQPAIQAKLAYLDKLEEKKIINKEVVEQIRLIHENEEEITVQVIIDRFAPEIPSFLRWILHLREKKGGYFTTEVLSSEVMEIFSHHLRALSWQDACSALLQLQEKMVVEEITRGEIGPIQLRSNQVYLSAVLTRLSPQLNRIFIDDPLADAVVSPAEETGFWMSHQRKWAVPRSQLSAHKNWLRENGSSNIVYGY